jgi:hypothetical protein
LRRTISLGTTIIAELGVDPLSRYRFLGRSDLLKEAARSSRLAGG